MVKRDCKQLWERIIKIACNGESSSLTTVGAEIMDPQVRVWTFNVISNAVNARLRGILGTVWTQLNTRIDWK